MRNITATASLLFISMSLAAHAGAPSIEELSQKRGQIDSLVEGLLSTPVVVEYDVIQRSYFHPDSPHVEILSADGQTVTFEYRGPGATMRVRSDTGETGYPALTGEIAVEPDTGLEMIQTESVSKHSIRELSGDYIQDRTSPEVDVHQRVIKRGDEYKVLDIMSRTGQVLGEQGGDMAAMIARGHSFRPSFYAQGIQQPYIRINASVDAFSIREDGEKLLLEERAPAPDGAQGPVGQTWEILEDDLLIRRQVGGPGMPMRTVYDGLQTFMAFPFPETIERTDYHPDGLPRARHIMTSIRLSEGDAASFEADMEDIFGQ